MLQCSACGETMGCSYANGAVRECVQCDERRVCLFRRRSDIAAKYALCAHCSARIGDDMFVMTGVMLRGGAG